MMCLVRRQIRADSRRSSQSPSATCLALLLPLLAFVLLSPVHATPTEQEIRKDISEFQRFFRARFPDLSVPDYQDGVAALPQFAQKRLNRELLSVSPPFRHAMERGRQQWREPLPGGASLQDCFAGRPPASAYPYVREGVIRTVVGDINECLESNGAARLDPLSGQMAELEAAFTEPWSGQLIDLDYRDEVVRDAYARGRQLFWAKRGQMNLSCANCHVYNAGNQLRGDVLSAALGHGAGFPAFRFSSPVEGGSMTTLHSRYAACNAMAGAAPFPAQSDEFIALEIYQAIMNSGVPKKVPATRQ